MYIKNVLLPLFTGLVVFKTKAVCVQYVLPQPDRMIEFDGGGGGG